MADTIKITVEVNGKQVPLSSLSYETIKGIKQREQEELEENAPRFFVIGKRLCMKITPQLIKRLSEEGILQITTPQYISFDFQGRLGAINMGDTFKKAKEYYPDCTTKPISF